MSCIPEPIFIDNIPLSTNDFINAQNLINNVSGDGGDPTADGYDENIANGNNNKGAYGVQSSPVTQTVLPGTITQDANAVNDGKPLYKSGIPIECLTWAGDYTLQLSPNFTVKSFTIGAYWPNRLIDLPAYSLTAQERCCNLQALSVNVAEMIFAKFGPFRINSGLRNNNTVSHGVSQHVSGQAIDIQFIGWSYDRYWNNAVWIRDNIPYDQFIFEHSDKTNLAWYHLSFNKAGNRPSADRTKVMTMFRNNYDSGLKKYY